jgi:hypothetical protein
VHVHPREIESESGARGSLERETPLEMPWRHFRLWCFYFYLSLSSILGSTTLGALSNDPCTLSSRSPLRSLQEPAEPTTVALCPPRYPYSSLSSLALSPSDPRGRDLARLSVLPPLPARSYNNDNTTPPRASSLPRHRLSSQS